MNSDIEAIERFFARQPCPYFADGRNARSEHIRFRGSLVQGRASTLLQNGWRRYGPDFYRMRCEDCKLCIPLRIDPSKIFISDSFKRILRINRDVIVVPKTSRFSEDHLRLWREYSLWKHLSAPEDLDATSFIGLTTQWSMIFEYRDGSPEGQLLAISHVDPVPDGFSSVYFSFSPSAESRSLGYYSVLAEACIAHQKIRSGELSSNTIRGESILEYYSLPRLTTCAAYYYLGFWVPGAAKMDYKARFRPFALLLTDGDDSPSWRWSTFESKADAENLLRIVHWPGLQSIDF